jgi:hypothetical protein
MSEHRRIRIQSKIDALNKRIQSLEQGNDITLAEDQSGATQSEHDQQPLEITSGPESQLLNTLLEPYQGRILALYNTWITAVERNLHNLRQDPSTIEKPLDTDQKTQLLHRSLLVPPHDPNQAYSEIKDLNIVKSETLLGNLEAERELALSNLEIYSQYIEAFLVEEGLVNFASIRYIISGATP